MTPSLTLPPPTPADLRALQADLSRQAGRDLSAREMGELMGYQGRGIADRRWREYLAGRRMDAAAWTLLLLELGRHPTHQVALACPRTPQGGGATAPGEPPPL